MNRFKPKWARCRPAHSIARSAILDLTYSMLMEGLNNYNTSRLPSKWTKPSIGRAVLQGVFGCFGGCRFEMNTDINGQREEMILSF